MLGIEIRLKVSDYVKQKIDALRVQHNGKYQNIAVVRTNAMKYFCNYFQKAQVSCDVIHLGQRFLYVKLLCYSIYFDFSFQRCSFCSRIHISSELN